MSKWNSLAVSLIGPKHVREGLPNQDSCLEYHNDFLDGIVVSDGVGSKRFSDVGSTAVCSAFVKTARALAISSDDFDQAFFLKKIKEYYLQTIKPFEDKDCSATCLFGLCLNQKKIIVGMLGDGLAAVVKQDDSVESLLDDKSTAYSNVVGAVMSSKTKEKDWKILQLDASECKAVLLCSDGVSDDLENLNAFVLDYVSQFKMSSKEEMIKETRNMFFDWNVPKCTDDQTLACLYRE